MRIENWSIVTKPDPYLAPELRGQYLHGKVYGNPSFADGEEVTTSRIALAVGNDAIRTKSGSIYELGAVDPAYEALYPNAQERLLKSLQQFGVKNEQQT